MALADSLTGDGNMVDSDVQTREYVALNAAGKLTDYTEDTETETREWVALTQAAAEAAVAANAQPVGGGTYTWSAAESVREVGSYKVRRLFRKVTYAEVP